MLVGDLGLAKPMLESWFGSNLQDSFRIFRPVVGSAFEQRTTAIPRILLEHKIAIANGIAFQPGNTICHAVWRVDE